MAKGKKKQGKQQAPSQPRSGGVAGPAASSSGSNIAQPATTTTVSSSTPTESPSAAPAGSSRPVASAWGAPGTRPATIVGSASSQSTSTQSSVPAAVSSRLPARSAWGSQAPRPPALSGSASSATQASPTPAPVTPTQSPPAASTRPATRGAWGAPARPPGLVGSVSISGTGVQTRPQAQDSAPSESAGSVEDPPESVQEETAEEAVHELASHVVPLGGFKRTKPGSGGRAIKILANFAPVNIDVGRSGARRGDGLYHQYDAISPTLKQPLAFLLIHKLQLGEGPEPIFDQRAINDQKDRVAYDGKKILLAPRPLLLGDGNSKTFEMSLHPVQIGQPPPRIYTVRLTKTTEVNPETLKRLIRGQQSSDESVLSANTALNIIFRMKPMSDCRKPANEQKIFSQGRFFFNEHGKQSLGPGYEVWRGYFQSIRPGIGRMFINIDTSAALMYTPGPLINLCLQYLGERDPNRLTMQGLTMAGWTRLDEFVRGVKVVITPATPGRPHRTAVARGLTRRGASQETFTPRGQTNSMSIAQYYLAAANVALRFPNLLCIEVGQDDSISTIPLEKCAVPTGCFMRKEIPERIQKDFIKFASQKPSERLANIRQSLTLEGILNHRDSEYLNAFDIAVIPDAMPITINARVLKPHPLRYNATGKQVVVTPKSGAWNMLETKFFQGSTIKQWVMVIYESKARFTEKDQRDAVGALIKECERLGIRVENTQPLVKYCNGQGNQLRDAGLEMKALKGILPNLILVVIPTGGGTIYKQVKFFGDVQAGVPTQCVKSPTCRGANSQYWANVCAKINPKLGGVNFIPDSSSGTFRAISDPRMSTIIMGADVTHPAPGPSMKSMPSYSSVVTSLDSSVSKYVALLQVQRRQESISGLREMAKACIKTRLLEYHMDYKIRAEKKSRDDAEPKRLIFYRDGVSEGEYRQVLEKEACIDLNIHPKITFIIVGKRHHARFFPNDQRDADKSGNCPAGTVVDTEIVHPTEDDFYLQSHGGILGTSRSAHYIRIYDENDFRSLLLTVSPACQIYSIGLTAGSRLLRAQNHYDPSAPPKPDPTSDDPIKPYRDAFKQTNEMQVKRMYFM
ncbi:hypothetical protein VNI00_009853 [Paramarasmius palmivorus]|uniref:Uncharacterized protein n=1 Tax=Paramarasmius palmivorus TaxID=297713 RepID=A0AAW0CQB0_9AGAR